MAAWCPCSTAQMMFSGPHAASPPKKTPGREHWNVTLSTLGIPHLSSSMPMSRSIQGNAPSCPMARMTASAGMNTVSMILLLVSWPFSSGDHSSRSKSIPLSLPSSMTKDLGAWLMRISHLLLLRVLQLPGGGLEVGARAARHDLDVLAAEPARGAAAVHRGVADADDEHALLDGGDVPEGHAVQPVDADEDLVAVVAAGDLQVLPLGGARADEDRVELAPVEQRLHALDGRVVADVGAHPEDHVDLVVEHLRREAERGDVGPHQPAGDGELLEDRHGVAERQQIVGDRERRRPRADERDALAVLLRGRARQPRRDHRVVTVVRGDALEAADRHRLLVHAAPPARRLAGPVARAPEDAGEHVGLPVEEVRVRVAALRDEPDVLGDVGVSRAGPLAIDNLVKVLWIASVRRRHFELPAFAAELTRREAPAREAKRHGSGRSTTGDDASAQNSRVSAPVAAAGRRPYSPAPVIRPITIGR